MPNATTLSEDVRLALFRIYQQMMANAIRHARAGNIWVNFYFSEGRIFLEIEDDGIGFEVPERWIELARQGRFGLADAAERAEALGSSLEVLSKPGRGTLVRVAMSQPPAEQ